MALAGDVLPTGQVCLVLSGNVWICPEVGTMEKLIAGDGCCIPQACKKTMVSRATRHRISSAAGDGHIPQTAIVGKLALLSPGKVMTVEQ